MICDKQLVAAAEFLSFLKADERSQLINLLEQALSHYAYQVKTER
jgi:hypothetical protein